MHKEIHYFYHQSRSREEKAMHNSMGRDEEAYAKMGELIEHASGTVAVYQGEAETYPDKFIVVCIPACFACDHPAVVARWEKAHCTPTGRFARVYWETKE